MVSFPYLCEFPDTRFYLCMLGIYEYTELSSRSSERRKTLNMFRSRSESPSLWLANGNLYSNTDIRNEKKSTFNCYDPSKILTDFFVLFSSHTTEWPYLPSFESLRLVYKLFYNMKQLVFFFCLNVYIYIYIDIYIYSTGHFIMDFIFSTEKRDWVRLFHCRFTFFNTLIQRYVVNIWKYLMQTSSVQRLATAYQNGIRDPHGRERFFFVYEAMFLNFWHVV